MEWYLILLLVIGTYLVIGVIATIRLAIHFKKVLQEKITKWETLYAIIVWPYVVYILVNIEKSRRSK